MSTYAETKRVMMDAYPTLFVDEADVLHHLFFVNGNGYEWVEGELVDVFDPDIDSLVERRRRYHIELAQKELDKARQEAQRDKRASPAIKRHLERRVKYYEGRLALEMKPPKAQRAAERRYRIRRCKQERPAGSRIRSAWIIDKQGELRRFLYPLCEYADILHTPADVKPDWLKAAMKALTLVGGPFIHRPGDARTNKKYLRQALKLLQAFTVREDR